MVFRFSTEQDCEMMRDLIRLKPFAAERGTTLDVWDNVAKSLSTALKVEFNKKKEADIAQCAKDIVAESNRRRADPEAELSDSDVSDGKQKQFDDGLAFEREQAQAKLQFDMEVQANNRKVILECAKNFSAALANKDE
ncbi:hypothetical protein F443_00442 [Phytophthora nicotianae P1569]|uniref:Uncharacterized protein n=1 Tax=Phytophthora nicotianae P1569 TaxID=1317065 RepID=V9G2T6_PHYNI|nr:hypothetical protein F443_00442 [Phytophthora nicotianae P1569]